MPATAATTTTTTHPLEALRAAVEAVKAARVALSAAPGGWAMTEQEGTQAHSLIADLVHHLLGIEGADDAVEAAIGFDR